MRRPRATVRGPRNERRTAGAGRRRRGQRMAAVALGLGFAGILCTGLARALKGSEAKGLSEANAQGNVQGIAALLFTRYVFIFEVTSVLLITAAVGAMLLAHIERRKQ